jgi:outer membrane protein OmpA-like peptidoglycan-associated protein
MVTKTARWCAAILVVVCWALPLLSQDVEPENKKLKSASLDGTTGLFRAWDAETLRRHEFNVSVGFDRHFRDPGDLRFSLLPVAASVGLTNRFEVFFSADTPKRVDARNIRLYRVVPGALPVPAWTPLGAAAFNNDAPFIDVPSATGLGDLRLGGKFNLFSERRKDPFAVSLVGLLTFPHPNSITQLDRGLGNGAWQGGWGALASKVAGRVAELYGNAIINFVSDPVKKDVVLADLQDEFQYRAGAAFPAQRRIQGIAELNGIRYFGSRTLGLNPRSPVDVILGFRVYPRQWISFGAGYQASLNHIEDQPAMQHFAAGTHGMVAQLAVGRRVNHPPRLTCQVVAPTIKQDETTTVRASAVDPDGDPLSYAWSTTGGKIAGSGDVVTFDATGAAPGKYTVTVSVSDGKYEVTCSSEITVIKKNLAPTVSCSSGVTVTVGESTTIRATASDPNGDPLTYTWTINGERIAAAGPELVFGSEGRQPGNYTVTVTVSDGEFNASCSSTVAVQPKPNRPPTIECVTCAVDVPSGRTAQLQIRASDPDGDKLAITWTATGGSVRGEGETAIFDATGLHAGAFTVTATADDGRGGRASTNIQINVSEAQPLTGFRPQTYRVNNEMKAALDDIAVRMNNEPRLQATIIGHTDGSRRETRLKGLGLKRAQAVADYLKGKGIDPSRISVADGGAANPIGDNKTEEGRKLNRRVEIELVVR